MAPTSGGFGGWGEIGAVLFGERPRLYRGTTPRRFPAPWTTYYFSILIVRVVVAPQFLQV
jgi:hypothetical protein